jgi:hypothetical protein
MYLDSAINRKPTVIRTIYNASLMAAFRFHAIVTHMLCPRRAFWRKSKGANVVYLARTIDECCKKMGRHIRPVGRRSQVKTTVTTNEVRWICLEAFARKLARHGDKYAAILIDIAAIDKAEYICEVMDICETPSSNSSVETARGCPTHSVR